MINSHDRTEAANKKNLPDHSNLSPSDGSEKSAESETDSLTRALERFENDGGMILKEAEE